MDPPVKGLTGLQDTAAGLHCKNFSIEMHERGLLDRFHTAQKGQINVRAAIGVGFSHGEAVEGDASFPQQRGKPVNRIKGICLGRCCQ